MSPSQLIAFEGIDFGDPRNRMFWMMLRSEITSVQNPSYSLREVVCDLIIYRMTINVVGH